MSPSPTAIEDPASKEEAASPPAAQTSQTSGAQQSIPKVPQFPPHNAPRVWFISDGLAPIAISLSRYLLDHGDYVVVGVLPTEFAEKRGYELREFLTEVAHEREEEEREDEENGDYRTMKRWRERFRLVPLDGRFVILLLPASAKLTFGPRVIGQCQSAIAEAIQAFNRIDVLLICRSFTLVGTLEELSQSGHTLSFVRDQYETNFFAPVNLIKAVLPSMREAKNGHIIVITGITAHLGTPGLGVYCSSQWAIEGYCDSLAYEIAPFNVKMTIVQPNLEIGVLTNKIVAAPPMAEYAPDVNPAPLLRDILSSLLDKMEGSLPLDSTFGSTTSPTETSLGDTPISPGTLNMDIEQVLTQGEMLSASTVTEIYPKLDPGLKPALIAETVFAIAAIGGHDNPPARHIVGMDGVTAVKEKLKTVSEELEDFIDVSAAVDIAKEDELIPATVT